MAEAMVGAFQSPYLELLLVCGFAGFWDFGWEEVLIDSFYEYSGRSVMRNDVCVYEEWRILQELPFPLFLHFKDKSKLVYMRNEDRSKRKEEKLSRNIIIILKWILIKRDFQIKFTS